MNDKELLKLAAKASGVVGVYYESDNPIHTGVFAGSTNHYWNPLIDDGDALRLAVKLHMHLDMRSLDPGASTIAHGWLWEQASATERAAATRRAIVRAAAEIGKGVVMPNAPHEGAEPPLAKLPHAEVGPRR